MLDLLHKFSHFVRAHWKLLALSIFLSGTFVCYIASFIIIIESASIANTKKCLFHDGRNPNDSRSITYFEDLLTSVMQPAYDQGIFFIDTKCSDNGLVDLEPRHACSIESAAKANPAREIFLIFSSPVGLPRHERNWPSTIKPLMKYPNIHFRNVQLRQLCANTPLADWIDTSALFKSIALLEHASDIMRALLVYKYGGTCMDQNYMMLQSLDSIDRNWIALQNSPELNGVVFDLRRSGNGYMVLNEVLSDIAENFGPGIWHWNGSACFSRVMERICNVSDLMETLNPDLCRGVQVYSTIFHIPPHSPKRFYRLFGPETHKFFHPNAKEYVLDKTERRMRNVAIARQQFNCPRIYAEHRMV